MYEADASLRVLIAEKPAWGELRNPIFPESIGHEKEWEWSVEVWNVGGLAGDFRIKLTGDRIDESQIFRVLPWQPITVMGPTVIGPANFQVHLELVSWVLGDSYHHVVGSMVASPKVDSLPRALSTEVAVEVGESIEGVDFPGAELTNPNYPSEVGPDEEWEGSIYALNSGTRRGLFKARLAYDGSEIWFDPNEIQAGWGGLCLLRAQGPLDFTWELYLADEFIEHDSLAVSVPQRTSPPGELRNLIFPKFGVGLSEDWEGSVEAWNHGTSTETFRVNMTGDISALSDEFQLAPGENTIVTFSHTGFTPNGFTATIQRMMGEEWMDDDSKLEVDGVGERITAWWKITGLYDQVAVEDPGAKIFMDGELLETSSLEREPIQVDLGRRYDTLVTVRGLIIWTYPTRWDRGNSRNVNFLLRWVFPDPP